MLLRAVPPAISPRASRYGRDALGIRSQVLRPCKRLADDANRSRIGVAKTFEAEADEALNRDSAPSHLIAMSFS